MTNFRTAKRFLFPLLGIWVLLYGSFSLLKPPLLDNADSVHAEVAREILQSHDWITLHVNGIRYLEKAPLLYWSMAVSFKLFGPTDWAARLPLAFYALGLFAVTFSLGHRLFGSPVTGFYAVLALMTSFGIFIYTHMLLPDVMVCLWTTLAIYFFWRSLEEDTPTLTSALGFAVACALNVLTKGLIGAILPVAIVLLFLFFTRNLRHILHWHPLVGLLVFLIIALPWHIAAGIANPAQGNPQGPLPTPGNVHGFWWFYFWNEQVLRYVGRRIPHDYGTAPLILFWVVLFLWIVPWSAFSLKALAHLHWRDAFTRKHLRRVQQALLLCSIWVGVVMVFFSFSTRLEYYVLPALPALALLAGGWLAREESYEPTSRYGAWILLAFGILGAAFAVFFAVRSPLPPPGTDIATLLHPSPGLYPLAFGHLFDLTAQAMGAFKVPLWITAIALLAGVVGNLWYRLRGRVRIANCFLAGMMAGCLIAAHLALNTFSPVLSSAILAQAIKPELNPDDVIVINGEYENASALSFYLERQVRILNGHTADLWYGSFFPDAPAIFEDDDSVAKLWQGSNRVFLWTAPDELPALPGQIYVIGRSGGKEIVSNQPNAGGANF